MMTASLTTPNKRLVSAATNPELLQFYLQKAIRRISIINHRKFIRIEVNRGNDKVTLELEAMIPNHEIKAVK